MTRRQMMGVAAGALGTGRLLAAPKVPRAADELVIRMNSGEQLLLSAHRGKVVAVEVLLTTCPHCQKCTALLQKMMEEFGPQGFQPVGAAINDEARWDLIRYLNTTSAKFPIGVTPREMAYSFLQENPMANKPIYMPQLVFIDRKGVVREQYGGADDYFKDEENNLRKSIKSLLLTSPATPGGAKKS